MFRLDPYTVSHSVSSLINTLYNVLVERKEMVTLRIHAGKDPGYSSIS